MTQTAITATTDSTTATSASSAAHVTAPALEVNESVRDLIAAMPVVIFANAVRDALRRPVQAARNTAYTFRR